METEGRNGRKERRGKIRKTKDEMTGRDCAKWLFLPNFQMLRGRGRTKRIKILGGVEK